MKFVKFKKRYKDSEDLCVELDKLETYKKGNDLLLKDVRSELIDGIWNVHPIMMNDKIIYIVCPYCGEVHSHGAGSGSYTGTRVIHCKDEDTGIYDIRLIMA